MLASTLSSIWRHHSIDRYAPIYMFTQICLFLIGAMFWLEARSDGAAFSPDTWGDLAYMLPVEFWALTNLFAATVTFLGLADPRHNRMVMIGALTHVAQFAALGVSIIFTGGESVVGLYAALYFLPLHVVMWWQAYNDQ